MKHLGDITKISGYEAPVVDVVIGGSPCQDLSVAGKRAGLAGERSGLYMDQIRIIKEMREKDAGYGRSGHLVRPRFMVWENVPGAFSSNGGKDFAAVIEEAIRVADPEAPSVPVPEKGWPTSGVFADEQGRWSVAWRVLDAQFWGVPQRRRRIALVADFGGLAAPEILFVREGVSGYFAQGRTPWQTAAGDAQDCAGAGDRAGNCLNPWDYQTKRCYGIDGIFPTLSAGERGGQNQQTVCIPVFSARGGAGARGLDAVAYKTYDARGNGDGAVVSTLTGDHNNRITDYSSVVVEPSPVYCLQGNGIDRADTAGCNGAGWREGASYTLNTIDRPAVVYAVDQGGGKSSANVSEGVSPTLCTTHGGEPVVSFAAGGYGNYTEGVGTLRASGGDYGGGTEAPVAYCVDSRNATEYQEINATLQSTAAHNLNSNNVVRTHYTVRRLTPLECERLQGFPDGWTDIGEWVDSKGKKHKDADSPRYKALGNSIAIPPWKWVCKRLCACYERDATMASLFDGIGGFPLIWEQLNGKGSCLWASEIDEFPMAVTKLRFGGEEDGIQEVLLAEAEA